LIEIAHVVIGIWAFINFFRICVKILIPNRDDDTLCRAYRPFAWILFVASIIFFTWGPLADHRSPGEKAKAAQLDADEDLVGWSLLPNASPEETAAFIVKSQPQKKLTEWGTTKMDLSIIIMIVPILAALIGTPILQDILRRWDASVSKEVYGKSRKDRDAQNILLGCQIQCNGLFDGDFQTKEEARTWLESRNLL
jgi:hypothetical protein